MQHKKTNLVLISICDEFAVGIRSLADFVEQYGYKTRQYFLGQYIGLAQTVSEDDINCLVRAVAAQPPDVVGISLRSFYRDTALQLTLRLRQALPTCLIVWGGIHPTIMPDECLQHADVICLGEGEESLLELLETLEDGTWPKTIEGMWIKHGSSVLKGSFRLPIQDLDRIPFPRYGGKNKFLVKAAKCTPYDGIPLGQMTKYGIRKYNTITSRGCSFACSYCVNSLIHEQYPKVALVRRRSVEHVTAELNAIKEQIDMIDFQDDDFLANREWVQQFMDTYTAQIAVPFICLASPLHIRDEDYLRRLRQAGLVSICVGIQSGSKRTQKIFQRSFDRASTVRISEMSNRLGILAQFDVILNNPFETEEDVTETLNLLLDLRRPFRLNLFSLTFFPNYKITRTAIERGLIKDAETGYTKLENEKGDYAQDSRLNNLIYLTQVSLFPKALIRWMAKSTWLKHHPQVTKFWVRLTQHTLGGRLTYLALLAQRNPRAILTTLVRRKQAHTLAKV